MFKSYLYFNYVSYLLTLFLNLYTKSILNQIIEPGLTRSNHIKPWPKQIPVQFPVRF